MGADEPETTEFTPAEVYQIVGTDAPRPPGPGSLKPGDAPSGIHPGFTRLEAWKARKRGRLPITPELERAIAADVMKGTPSGAIAAKHGYAASYAGQLVKQPGVLKQVRDAYRRAGLDPDLYARKHAELLNATKSEFAKFQGVIQDVVEVEDNGTRLGALRLALEMEGVVGQTPARGGGETGPRLVIVNAEEAVFFGDPHPGRPDGESGV